MWELVGRLPRPRRRRWEARRWCCCSVLALQLQAAWDVVGADQFSASASSLAADRQHAPLLAFHLGRESVARPRRPIHSISSHRSISHPTTSSRPPMMDPWFLARWSYLTFPTTLRFFLRATLPSAVRTCPHGGGRAGGSHWRRVLPMLRVVALHLYLLLPPACLPARA